MGFIATWEAEMIRISGRGWRVVISDALEYMNA